MKLCVVGNSHAAAIRGALSAGEGAASVHVDFFVMPGGAGPHLQADGARLYPDPRMASKAFSTIPRAITDGFDLSAFDAVMICAAGLPSHRNGDADHILSRLALASLVNAAPQSRQGVSEAVMTSVIESALHASPNFASIRLIRSVFSGPLVIQVCPLPTRALAAYKTEGERGSNLAMLYGDRVWSFLSWYYRQQVALIRAFADSQVAHVIPPEEDVLNAGLTPGKFGTPDPWHMNAAYGRLILNRALAVIASISSA